MAIHRQIIPEPQSCVALQRKQLPVTPYGSPCASQRGLHTSVKMFLSALKYDDYGWEVIGDFKMVSFPMDLQGGFTKLHFFLCVWDSRDNTSHYHRKDWLQRSEFSVGNGNVKWESLTEPQKVLMPITAHQVRPHQAIFHCSWQVVSAFKYLKVLFPKLSKSRLASSLGHRSRRS